MGGPAVRTTDSLDRFRWRWLGPELTGTLRSGLQLPYVVVPNRHSATTSRVHALDHDPLEPDGPAETELVAATLCSVRLTLEQLRCGDVRWAHGPNDERVLELRFPGVHPWVAAARAEERNPDDRLHPDDRLCKLCAYELAVRPFRAAAEYVRAVGG